MSTREDADKIIKQHVTWAVGAGFVPVPVLDIAAVTLMQLDMLKQLCRLYEASYSESSGKALLSAVTGSTLASIGASIIKSVPGIGTALGVVSMPILSGASTYAIGQAVVYHFESEEGSLGDIDFGKIKEIYEENLQKGKEFASKIYERRKKASSENSAEDVVDELEKLLNLKEEGDITEEEFETRKQELLEQI